jgi:glycerol-3-phosphate acyltransferase PlsY
MTITWVVVAAVLGYLLGSLSWARIVARRVAPEADISTIREPVPNTDLTFVSDSISATAARVHLGTRYGCLVAILDMLKVAIPTLAFRLAFPDQPYFFVAAFFGLVGHVWPLYHHFKGGRGESAIYGGLLVIDPLGVLVTNLAGALLGVLAGELLVLRWGGLVLMMPWMWLRFESAWAVAYIVGANIVYWYSMRPELSQYFRYQGQGVAPTQEELAEFMAMGTGLGRFMDRYSIPALVRRSRQPK